MWQAVRVGGGARQRNGNALCGEVQQVELFLALATIAVTVLQNDPWRVISQQEALQLHSPTHTPHPFSLSLSHSLATYGIPLSLSLPLFSLRTVAGPLAR